MATKCNSIAVSFARRRFVSFWPEFPLKLFRLLRGARTAFNAKIHWNFAHTTQTDQILEDGKNGGGKLGANGEKGGLSMQHLYAILLPRKKNLYKCRGEISICELKRQTEAN